MGSVTPLTTRIIRTISFDRLPMGFKNDRSNHRESPNLAGHRKGEAMSRRGFLQGLGGAGASLGLGGWAGASPTAPNLLLGGDALPATEKIQLAVIGVGGHGRYHVNQWAKNPQSQLVAVCDVHRGRAAKAREAADAIQGKGSCTAYQDFRELLARKDIDAVSIATPDHWHALLALAAIRAGKHVYLEKPVAYSVTQGRAIADAVSRHGIILQNGTQQRSTRFFQRTAWHARSGHLGRLTHAIATSPYGLQGGDPTLAEPPAELDYGFWLGPAPLTPYTVGRDNGAGGVGWYHMRDYSGGWITGWGSHHVDSAQWALGKDGEAPVSVEATGEFPKEGIYNTCIKWRAEFTYADGKKLIFATPNEAPGQKSVLVHGEEGWVCADRSSIDAENKTLLKQRPEPIPGTWYSDHYLDFLDAIRFGREPSAPIGSAHLSTTLCHLANIAIAVGRPLKWDGTRERFPDDPDANKLIDPPMRPPWKLEG